LRKFLENITRIGKGDYIGVNVQGVSQLLKQSSSF